MTEGFATATLEMATVPRLMRRLVMLVMGEAAVVTPRPTTASKLKLVEPAAVGMGTTVAPGFDFADYESGRREELCEQFPGWRGWVERLCR